MPVDSVQALFIQEVARLYNVEQRMAQLLASMAADGAPGPTKERLLDHERESQEQIDNLRHCLLLFNAYPDEMETPVVDGFERRYQAIASAEMPAALGQLQRLGLVATMEHHEIGDYRNLIDMANILGQFEAARLLHQNLRQEEAMARQVESILRRSAEQALEREGEREA